MADPNNIYRSSFSRQQLDRFDDEFERGIDDDNQNVLTIKTPGARKKNTEFNANSRPTFTGAFPSVFTFSMNSSTRLNSPPFGGLGGGAAKPKPKGKKKKTKKSAGYGVNNTEDDGDDDDDDVDFDAGNTEPATTRFGRNLRPRNVDVASKEVIEDGGANAAPPIDFVSLNQASRHQSKRNIGALLEEADDLCDSSCDELEERVAALDRLEDEKERQHRNIQITTAKRGGAGGVAVESLDEVSYSGAGSTEKSKKRKHDAGGESEYSKHNESKKYRGPDDSSSSTTTRSLPSKRPGVARATAETGGGDGDGGGGGNDDGKSVERDHRPGRSVSSSMNCFLCRYGHRQYDAVSRPQMVQLCELLEQGVGHSDPVTLARTVHLKYMNSIFRDGRLDGQRLPVWRTKHVLEHILYHENDPRYFLWLSIIDTRRTIDCLSSTMFAKHPVNGAMLPTKNAELKMKFEDHLLKLYAKSPDTMNFHQPAAQIDLARNNRRIEGITQKRKPKHYAHTVVAEVDGH